MKTEPLLDKRALIAALQHTYGYDIEELLFLPAGWAAYNYVAGCPDGHRLFLKLYDQQAPDMTVASDPRFYLPLTYQLCTQQILPCIPCPIPARHGQLSTHFGTYELQLWTHVDGRTLGLDDLSDEVLTELAHLVGILHRSLPQLHFEHPLVERFDLPFERDLLQGLQALESVTDSDRTGQRRLRELLLPRRDELLHLLERLRQLQGRARADGRRMVVCHTDLHGENLMRDAAGTLYIIDWETAMIAPPEHDLFFWAAEERFWDQFLPLYEEEVGLARLEPDALAFYVYRRNLEDVAGFVQHVLCQNTGDEQDTGDLGFLEECLADWPRLEPTVAAVSARLKARTARQSARHTLAGGGR